MGSWVLITTFTSKTVDVINTSSSILTRLARTLVNVHWKRVKTNHCLRYVMNLHHYTLTKISSVSCKTDALVLTIVSRANAPVFTTTTKPRTCPFVFWKHMWNMNRIVVEASKAIDTFYIDLLVVVDWCQVFSLNSSHKLCKTKHTRPFVLVETATLDQFRAWRHTLEDSAGSMVYVQYIHWTNIVLFWFIGLMKYVTGSILTVLSSTITR